MGFRKIRVPESVASSIQATVCLTRNELHRGPTREVTDLPAVTENASAHPRVLVPV